MRDVSISILKKVKPPLRWEPAMGRATEEFLRLKASSANGPDWEALTIGENSVLQEAQRVLGRCLPPTSPPAHEAGLVVGFVQSGKTLSFETVISLARDNKYGLVIVLAGTKTNLREQSEDRLVKDLGIDEGSNWHHYSNPARSDAAKIADRLDAWKRNPGHRRGVLITLLKRQNYLSNLAQLLSKLSLGEVPTLLIDDESDQASLNTQASRISARRVPPDTRSAVYNGVCELRERLPHHSLLQYTATPQANLLLAQADLLNPSFAELVTPGGDYSGGKVFFNDHPELLVDIPAAEVPGPQNIVRAAPKSLLSALRYFLLVAAQHSLTRTRGDRNRSMMIHPSMQTSSHRTYKDWIDKGFKAVKRLVQHNGASKIVMDLFQGEYASLAQSFPEISQLEELIAAMSEEVFDEVSIVEINRTPDAEKKVKWNSNHYWILVGGEKLGRGYTVEGLAVTYMPRPLGTSPNADTLQQRARFFGYKRSYLGLCRVFLQADVKDAFTAYVEHEESLRAALAKRRGQPLTSWRRDFLLDASLRATRANVMGRGARRVLVRSWMTPDVMQRDSAAAKQNRTLLTEVHKKWVREFGPQKSVSSLPIFSAAKSPLAHLVIQDVPLRSILDDFLLKVEIRDPRDAEEHSAMLIGLAAVLDANQHEVVDVFLMNALNPQYRSRRDGRGQKATQEFAPIGQYFSQTAGALNDKSFHTHGKISLQLRRFDLGTVARDPGSVDIRAVTWFSLYVPPEIAKHAHIENRL